MNPSRTPGARAPDRDAALAQYRRRADVYDLELALFEPIRRRAIARLAPQPGEVVLDIGCGTGLSLSLLRQGVGARGRIVGIEQSPEMLEQARRLVGRMRWRNVTLLCSPVEAAELGLQADAALFHFTHDILRNAGAVEHVMRHLRPGARVVSSGLKWAPAWRLPVNLVVLPAALRSVTTLEGLHAPWSRIEPYAGPLEIESLLLGAVYIASGRVAPWRLRPAAAAATVVRGDRSQQQDAP